MAFLNQLSALFSAFSHLLSGIIFFEIWGLPLVVLWLIVGATFATLRLGLINLRAFGHAIAVLLGKYDTGEEEGEISSFQAMATALSASVGLGNIAGVAIAIRLGGPGAVVWMVLGGFLGMSIRFMECTLGQKYRVVRPDGTTTGGPMFYLSEGLERQGYGGLGQVLATFFALCCLFGALGACGMFQANQAYAAVSQVTNFPAWLYGLILTGLIAAVIWGGIQRIGQVAATLLPILCGIYMMASLWVLIVHASEIPAAVNTIINGTLHPDAIAGGLVGVIAQGLRRSTFSNYAGTGAAAIVHSATRTEEPVREGIVSMLEPFIDTAIICNITALVLILTGVYSEPSLANLDGSQLTSAAFGTVIPWFPALLAVLVSCFAFSTAVSWEYYGESCWSYLLGDVGEDSVLGYKILFLIAIFFGPIVPLGIVIDFSDSLFLAMAFPNILGIYFFSNGIAQDLQDYMQRLHQGEMDLATRISTAKDLGKGTIEVS